MSVSVKWTTLTFPEDLTRQIVVGELAGIQMSVVCPTEPTEQETAKFKRWRQAAEMTLYLIGIKFNDYFPNAKKLNNLIDMFKARRGTSVRYLGPFLETRAVRELLAVYDPDFNLRIAAVAFSTNGEVSMRIIQAADEMDAAQILEIGVEHHGPAG